jgi:hypothetical protein
MSLLRVVGRAAGANTAPRRHRRNGLQFLLRARDDLATAHRSAGVIGRIHAQGDFDVAISRDAATRGSDAAAGCTDAWGNSYNDGCAFGLACARFRDPR